MVLNVTLPAELVSRLEALREAHNRTHPLAPMRLQDLIRRAVAQFVNPPRKDRKNELGKQR